MKSSIRRFSFFALAAAVGASAFGLFWSIPAQGRGAGGTNPSYCNSTGGATMCYNGTTVNNVPPATQASYLANNQATCGACPTSPP